MQPIVQVTNLSKQFNNFQAVSDLSFTVYSGDVYGFLGQNGAGKSTTIRMLLTLIAPTSGDINIFGLPLNHQNRNRILSKTGAVIERPDLYKYLTAFENLQLFAKLSNAPYGTPIIMEQLERVGLAQRAKDVVKNFSQGMKQRLGIAIALVNDPQLVILDEPTNGLDPQGIADVRNLILQLSKEQGKTVIVSSHLLSEIEQIASRVLIIDKGRKLVEGASTELFDPQHTVVEINTGNNALALEKLSRTQWKENITGQRNGLIILDLDKKRLPDLHKSLIELDIELISSQPRHRLEDYFLQITTENQHVPTFSN